MTRYRCYCGRWTALRSGVSPERAILCARCFERGQREHLALQAELCDVAREKGWPAIPAAAMTGASRGGPSAYRAFSLALNDLGLIYLINRLKNGTIPAAEPPISDDRAALTVITPSRLLSKGDGPVILAE